MSEEPLQAPFEFDGEPGGSSLVDLVDHLLDQGCVIRGDLVLGIADVDLIYCELSLLLCSVDRLAKGKSRP